jgi:hypothetical protein
MGEFSESDKKLGEEFLAFLFSTGKKRKCSSKHLLNYLHKKKTKEFTKSDTKLRKLLLLKEKMQKRPFKRLLYYPNKIIRSTILVGVTIFCAVILALAASYLLLKAGF